MSMNTQNRTQPVVMIAENSSIIIVERQLTGVRGTVKHCVPD